MQSLTKWRKQLTLRSAAKKASALLYPPHAISCLESIFHKLAILGESKKSLSDENFVGRKASSSRDATRGSTGKVIVEQETRGKGEVKVEKREIDGRAARWKCPGRNFKERLYGWSLPRKCAGYFDECFVLQPFFFFLTENCGRLFFLLFCAIDIKRGKKKWFNSTYLNLSDYQHNEIVYILSLWSNSETFKMSYYNRSFEM